MIRPLSLPYFCTCSMLSLVIPFLMSHWVHKRLKMSATEPETLGGVTVGQNQTPAEPEGASKPVSPSGWRMGLSRRVGCCKASGSLKHTLTWQEEQKIQVPTVVKTQPAPSRGCPKLKSGNLATFWWLPTSQNIQQSDWSIFYQWDFLRRDRRSHRLNTGILTSLLSNKTQMRADVSLLRYPLPPNKRFGLLLLMQPILICSISFLFH